MYMWFDVSHVSCLVIVKRFLVALTYKHPKRLQFRKQSHVNVRCAPPPRPPSPRYSLFTPFMHKSTQYSSARLSPHPRLIREREREREGEGEREREKQISTIHIKMHCPIWCELLYNKSYTKVWPFWLYQSGIVSRREEVGGGMLMGEDSFRPENRASGVDRL